MNIREKIVKGGAYLIVRQGFGLIISLGGVVLLTRAIGPENYGFYATAFGIVGYLSNLAGLGVSVYLVRREAEPGVRVYDQAFTLLFISGVTEVLLGVMAIPLMQRWFHNPAFIPPLLTMLLVLPLTAMTGPAMARLERDLNYRAVAGLELTGQIIYYLVTLSLAYQGKGVWAPVAGYVIWQLYLLLGACIQARLVPRPFWSRSLLAEMLGYGAGYSASIWLWQLRSLVNPLIVGRYAGPEGVAYTSLAIRFVEVLSFVKDVIWRLSIPALAKVQEEHTRLKRAIEEAMFLQVYAVGTLLAFFACIAPWIFPLLFGEKWSAALLIYPFVALGSLVNAVFNMHSSLLYVLRRNWEVSLFHLAHIILFAGGALLLIPRYGLSGYGLAEVIGILSYLVIHFLVGRIIRPSYLKVVPLLIAFIPPLFITILNLPAGFFLLLPLVVVLSICGSGSKVIEYGKLLK